MAPTTGITRYKPAIFLIAAVSTAYAIYLLRKQIFGGNEISRPQNGTLHRSNAVRHNGSRSRRRTRSSASRRPTSQAVRAIENLLARDEANQAYGSHNLSLETGSEGNVRTHPIAQIELLLSTVLTLDDYHISGLDEQVMRDVRSGVQQQVPTVFLHAFLTTEFNDVFPIGHFDRIYLQEQLVSFGFNRDSVSQAIRDFNADQTLGPRPETRQIDGAAETTSLDAILNSIDRDRQETLVETDSEISFDDGAEEESLNTSQNMMNLLYHIGGEQARRAYYIHRGVECNSCSACPIQGIRFHCVNCFDYDLCEACEALQVHIKTHVFLKIRIPGPTRGSVKEVTPVWYPGKPEMTRESLPSWVSKNLIEENKLERTELDALYEQFRTLASARYEADSLAIGMAIDRAGFDKYFVCSSKSRHAPPSLVYDRIFSFYDANNDGLIDFEEFVKGLMNLQDKNRDARLRRIFRGYDLDDDEFVDRKDFLRMFRSYYAWTKELNREFIDQVEEEQFTDGVRELIESSQPISAAFTGSIPHGHVSRPGVGKSAETNGDLIIRDGRGPLDEEANAHGDRNSAIGAAAMGHRGNLSNSHPFRTFRQQPATDEPVMIRTDTDFEIVGITHVDDANEEDMQGDDPTMQVYGWPPINNVEPSDIVNALGSEVPFEEIMDPVDRSRVFFAQAERLDAEYDRDQDETRARAIRERWQRRQFYLDQEEGMSVPPGYKEDDSSDDEGNEDLNDSATDPALASRRPSMRSRSSSKVRFEDSVTDTDYETRSNTSSRSVPVGERWGGFEISEAEREIGKELLYQSFQQGYNELLDQLFKEEEDIALAAAESQHERQKWSAEISQYAKEQGQKAVDKEEALRAADMLRTEELMAGGISANQQTVPLEEEGLRPDILDNIPIARTNNIVLGGPHTSLALRHPDDPLRRQVIARTRRLMAELNNRSAGPQLLANLNLDPDTASISSHNAQVESVDDMELDSEPRPDPTLPQNRPNSASSPPSSASVSFRCPPPRTLALYLTHNAYDEKSKRRGGPGKISFEEFAAKMIEDDGDIDQVGNALGRLKNGDEEERKGKWPTKAGLGKLQFVGQWFDWASF